MDFNILECNETEYIYQVKEHKLLKSWYFILLSFIIIVIVIILKMNFNYNIYIT